MTSNTDQLAEQVLLQWDQAIRGRCARYAQTHPHIEFDDYYQEARMAVWGSVHAEPWRDWDQPSIGRLIPSIVGRRCGNLAEGRAFLGEEGDNGGSLRRANPLRPCSKADIHRAKHIEELRHTSSDEGDGLSDNWELSIATEYLPEWSDAEWQELLHRIFPDTPRHSRERMRQLIDLRFAAGMSWSQIAGEMGLARRTPDKMWSRYRHLITDYYTKEAA